MAIDWLLFRFQFRHDILQFDDGELFSCMFNGESRARPLLIQSTISMPQSSQRDVNMKMEKCNNSFRCLYGLLIRLSYSVGPFSRRGSEVSRSTMNDYDRAQLAALRLPIRRTPRETANAQNGTGAWKDCHQHLSSLFVFSSRILHYLSLYGTVRFYRSTHIHNRRPIQVQTILSLPQSTRLNF